MEYAGLIIFFFLAESKLERRSLISGDVGIAFEVEKNNENTRLK